jgi:hypothetical protein
MKAVPPKRRQDTAAARRGKSRTPHAALEDVTWQGLFRLLRSRRCEPAYEVIQAEGEAAIQAGTGESGGTAGEAGEVVW